MAVPGYEQSTVAGPVRVHWLLLFALVASGYALGSQLAFTWFGADGVSASFFPAAGITFAALVLVAKRQWWVVLAAAGVAEFSVDVWHDIGGAASAGYVLANLTQPVVGALLFLAFIEHVDIGRTRDLAGFLAFGVVVGPAVGGAIGATTFVLDGGESWARFVGQWWVGDGLGVLVVGGAILSLRSDIARPVTRRLGLEALVLTVAGMLTAVAVLRADWFALVYVPIALLVVMAFRVGTRGVALMGAALAIVVAESTAEGHTFWESLDVSPKTALVYLQLGMGVVVASVLALAAEIAQRERAASALGRAEEEQRATAERMTLFDAERAARERAELLERRASELQSLTAELAAASTTHDVAQVVVSRFVPTIGGVRGSIFALDDDGVLRVIGHDSNPEEVIGAFQQIGLDDPLPPADALRLREPVLLDDVEMFRDRYPEIVEELGPEDSMYGRAWAHLPLVAGGRRVGVLNVAFAGPQRFDDEQQAHMISGTDAIAQALQRARLFELERGARERAELLERHAAHLAAAVTVREVAASTIADLESAGITIAVLGVVQGDRVETVGAHGIPDDVRQRLARLPLAEPSLLTEAICTGETVLLMSGEEYEARFPAFIDVRRAVGMNAFIAVPLFGGGDEPLGALAVSASESAWLDADRRQLIAAIAEQTGLALKRALLFHSERSARERAELLERHASHLVDTESVNDVASSTIADLALSGMDIALFGVVDGDSVRIAAASGLDDSVLEAHPSFELSRSTVMATTVTTGETVVAASGAEIDARFPDASLLRERTRAESIIGVPVRSGEGNVLGVLVATSPERDWVDGHRRQLITAVATQAGVALERAQLRESAERTAAHAQFLVELGDALEIETTVTGRARRLAELLVIDRATYAAVQVDQAPDTTLLLEAGDDDDALRVTTAPLRARGRTLGTLTVRPERDNPQKLSGLHLRDIAERAAIAIDNALLYERERHVSHSLQLGLLGEQASTPGSELATAYLPGTAMLEVGGDWYDSFELPNGCVAFVVGDVVGHGLEAAMAMGQLRGAVRALAPIGDPADLLRNLDVFVESVPETCMATLAYVELDLARDRLRYATAGHPPPIITSPSGDGRFLWDGRSAPLGSAVAHDRAQAVDALRPGELLLLYTDGLIERRGEGLDVMLDRLLRASARSGDETASELVERILATMLDGSSQADDVCLLAYSRLTLDRFTKQLPASPSEIAALRHALAEWLAERAVDDDTRRSLVLAVSEAVANAAEHAYGFDGVGVVDVEVGMDTQSTLRASIADRGTWRPPPASSDRGRGTLIMRALMEDVSIESGPDGTMVRMRLPAGEGVST